MDRLQVRRSTRAERCREGFGIDFGMQDAEDWMAVATLIPGVTAESCMFKWLSLKKVNLATNNWSV